MRKRPLEGCCWAPAVAVLLFAVLFCTITGLSALATVQGKGEESESQFPEEVLPEFAEPMANISVPVGRDARLPCVVSNLGSYRTAWLRVEDKGILTIHQHIITRNYRVSLTYSDNRNFVLHIKNIQESDRGGLLAYELHARGANISFYLCQINTVPMRSQVAYLDVVVPPDFVLENSSSDIIAAEGSNVSLYCKAKGYPEPSVRWRREDNAEIPLASGKSNKRILVQNVTGNYLNITRVSRIHMGAWLCVASNGVPPSVSRRILLHVHFAPAIWLPSPMVEASLNVADSSVTLNCHIEAYPSSTNYWMNSKGEPIEPSEMYEIKVERRSYKTHLQLVIRNVQRVHLGLYKCLAKNSLGTQERDIRVLEAGSMSVFAQSQAKQQQQHQRGHHSGNQLERSHSEFNDFASPSKVANVNQERAMASGSSFSPASSGDKASASSGQGSAPLLPLLLLLLLPVLCPLS